MLRSLEISRFLNTALECTVYHAPTDLGLTVPELVEAGRRAGYAEGETKDAIPGLHGPKTPLGRFIPDGAHSIHWSSFNNGTPDYRNIHAFDFMYAQLNANIREMGKGTLGVERNVIVERALADGIPRKDIEVAIVVAILMRRTIEKVGMVKIAQGSEYLPLPSQQLGPRPGPHNDMRETAYGIVGDIIARRTDDRPAAAEPLDAFAEALEGLGHGRFRMWWMQTVGELRRSNANEFPLSTLVLSAALVEGALTFVVAHAKGLDLGIFGSTDFGREPRTWKIDDLVAGAARGGDHAILDDATRRRAATLVQARQRIHAGRLLSEHSGSLPIPDLRPEDARDGKAVADQVVRRILDWLARYPR